MDYYSLGGRYITNDGIANGVKMYSLKITSAAKLEAAIKSNDFTNVPIIGVPSNNALYTFDAMYSHALSTGAESEMNSGRNSSGGEVIGVAHGTQLGLGPSTEAWAAYKENGGSEDLGRFGFNAHTHPINVMKIVNGEGYAFGVGISSGADRSGIVGIGIILGFSYNSSLEEGVMDLPSIDRNPGIWHRYFPAGKVERTISFYNHNGTVVLPRNYKDFKKLSEKINAQSDHSAR